MIAPLFAMFAPFMYTLLPMHETAALYLLSSLFLATAAALALTVVRLNRLKRNSAEPDSTVAVFEKKETASSELQTLFDSITDDISIINADFTIRNANARYLKTIGKTLKELEGKKCHELYWNTASPCEQCAVARVFKTGEPVLRQKVILKRGDEQKHLEISAYPVFDDRRKIVNVIEYVRDMTDEVHMIEQLIRSEKMAGIGVMTTGIAHEMNNALSGIAGTASNLLTMPEKFDLSEKAVNRIFSILDAATRATSVMKNLLQFSHPLREETRIMVNVKQVIKKIVTKVYIQEAPDIERRIQFDEILPPIKADLSKVELVLMNVITNAIRSILDKKTHAAKEGKPYTGSLVVSARRQQDMVLVTVTDNGVGIPENIRSKIFDPFFSTWPVSKGTGLGLSTALHIVEEHGGRIFFESVDDLTTFSILLPIDRKKPFEHLIPPMDGQSNRFQK
jgi:two-component system NtrC family sensor kinase